MNDKPGSLPTRTDVVVSADGTAISYRTLGKGPAVLDVPGALAVATDFDALARELADRFTVNTIERRGRGEGGPHWFETGRLHSSGLPLPTQSLR